MIINGIYTIKEEYFSDFPDPYLKQGKNGNRPCYMAIKEDNDIIWLIPMSSKVEKFKARIHHIEQKRGIGNCDLYYITTIANKESVFIIGDIFPITKKYIEKEYTIDDEHVILKNKNVIKTINKKARKILALINKNISLGPTQPDVLTIKKKLLR